MLLDTLIKWLELASLVATVAGVPVAITLFFLQKRKENAFRQIEIYFQSNDRYMAYLDKVLQYPELNCGEFLHEDTEVLQSGFNVQQLTLFTELILILEQSWYVYNTSGIARSDVYWKTWEMVYSNWAERADFRSAWRVIEPNIDHQFGRYMQKLIELKEQPPSA